MNIYIAIVTLSVICCVYAQTSYDPYDIYGGIGTLTRTGRLRGSRRIDPFEDIGLRTGARLRGSRRLFGGSILRGNRRMSRPGRGRVYTPPRYVDTGDDYIPRRRQSYLTSY